MNQASLRPSCHRINALRDGPLENLWGGGGGGRSTKKYSRKGNLNEKKNSCTPINPKKYSCYGLKNIHTRNLIPKKRSCGSKIPSPPPITFLIVRPLRHVLMRSQYNFIARGPKRATLIGLSAVKRFCVAIKYENFFVPRQ